MRKFRLRLMQLLFGSLARGDIRGQSHDARGLAGRIAHQARARGHPTPAAVAMAQTMLVLEPHGEALEMPLERLHDRAGARIQKGVHAFLQIFAKFFLSFKLLVNFHAKADQRFRNGKIGGDVRARGGDEFGDVRRNGNDTGSDFNRGLNAGLSQ